MLSWSSGTTLAKSVSNSVAVYKPNLQQNGQDNPRFLWGKTIEQSQVIHPISWNQMRRQPKIYGGLGLRRTKDMNKAL